MHSVLLLLALFLPPATAPSTPSPIHFHDVASQVGITKVPYTSSEMRYLLETMGGGIGLFDCDGDGKLDIVTVNGSSIDHFLQGGDPMITLYHQDAGLHFTDVTHASG
ncbi:MAG: hypothetical protein WBG23_17110, partial [Acidobacteriaceae bacterium]